MLHQLHQHHEAESRRAATAAAELDELQQGGQGHDWDYIYEPDAATVIDELLVRYVESQVYQAVAENMASEQSARMVAMKAATDNAGNVINEAQAGLQQDPPSRHHQGTVGNRGRRRAV